MTRRTFVPLACALLACAPRQPAPAASPASDAATTPETSAVTLERTPCFGSCPVYTVSIARSGTVRFTGRHHTAQTGEATAEIPPARVDSLIAELERAGYFEMADAYVMDSPACGMYATDSPTVITSATLRGKTKTIRHDRGCFAAPPALSRLEQRIDEVAGSRRWVGR